MKRYCHAVAGLGVSLAVGCVGDATDPDEEVSTAESALISTATAPTGAQAGTSIQFSWTTDTAVLSTDRFRVWVAAIYDRTYTGSQLGCVGATTCTTPTVFISPGSQRWHLSTNGGPFSGPVYFTVPGDPPPAAPTGLSPSGEASLSQVFSWNAASTATSYRLDIPSIPFNRTYTAEELGCGAGTGTCSTPAIALFSGTTATWLVRGLNTASGNGPQASTTYTTSGTPPIAPPTNISPTSCATASQIFTWTQSGDATSYRLWSNGTFDRTFTATELGCGTSGSTCKTPAVTLPATGSYNYVVRSTNAAGSGPWSGNVPITMASFCGVASLAGNQEVPVTASTATGTATFALNTAETAITYSITHDVVSPTAAHFHSAAAGTNDGVVFALTTGSPITGTWSAPSAANIAALKEGRLYINIHTAAFPGGAIRGQILRPLEKLYTAQPMLGANEVPASGATGTGGSGFILSEDATKLTYTGTVSGLTASTSPSSNPSAAHIHDGNSGVVGPVLYTLTLSNITSTSATFGGVVSGITAADIAKLNASGYYVNVHSAQFPSGALRAQLVPK
jgi:CHRD domain